jgi:hypothetical protein
MAIGVLLRGLVTAENAVLYRLPELLAASNNKPVYLVNGEKAADRVAQEGVVVTCSPLGEGKGKWKDEFTNLLRGAGQKLKGGPNQMLGGREVGGR